MLFRAIREDGALLWRGLLDEATSAGRVSIAIKLRLQRFTQDMVQLWHSRRFKEHNPGVIELGNDWDRFTNFYDKPLHGAKHRQAGGQA